MWASKGTFAEMLVSMHLENGSVARAVLAEVAKQQMDLAVLRLKGLLTQVAMVNHKISIRMEVVVAGIRIVALLHVLPPWSWPDDPWVFRMAETAVKKAMGGTPVSKKVLL